MSIYLKKDRFLRKRGGTAKLVEVACIRCKRRILLYQKDGPGWLKRCYLNRMFEPDRYAKLQFDKTIKEPEDMPKLICPSCRSVIGVPVRHKDGRLAFALVRGSFRRKTREKL
jgi:DNA-directed RNA polymerase subunit RPC12/RpoP